MAHPDAQFIAAIRERGTCDARDVTKLLAIIAAGDCLHVDEVESWLLLQRKKALGDAMVDAARGHYDGMAE